MASVEITSRDISLRYVDVHIHLADITYSGKVENILDEAAKVGVSSIVACAEDYQTSIETLRIAQKYPSQVYAALGLHPNNIPNMGESELEKIINLIEENSKKIVALGEIGLDRKIVENEIENDQVFILNALLGVAEKLNLPIIVHSRGASLQILEILPSYNIKKILLHWYSGPLDALPEIVKRGYYLSVGPSLLYAKYLQDIAAIMPLERLLTETDGPVSYRGPFKGKLTSPSFIPEVVNALTKIKQKSLDEVAIQVMKNFSDLFHMSLEG